MKHSFNVASARARKPASQPPARGRPGAGDGLSTLSVRATALAIACLLTGACNSIRINVIGEATLAELLLPLLGLCAIAHSPWRKVFQEKVFWILLLSMLVTLGGYVLSDLIRETPQAQYLRGWGRMALVITGFVCLSLLVSAHKQNLWWFVAGMGIGRVLYLRLALDTPISMWKFSQNGFGYGEPVTLVAAILAYFLPPRWAAGVLAAVGVISVHYDYRIQSLVCLFVAGLVWMRARRPNQPIRGGPLKLALILLASVVVIYAGLKISETRYSADRRDVSDIGRSVGKVFALKAIANSPIIGYGSWSRSRDFERMHEQAMKEVAGKQARRFTAGDSSSATHAMLLQAWVEGGILAIAFFVALGFCLLRELPRLALRRPLDGLSPLLAYFMIYGLWHIAMSAFAAPLRLHLALAAASIVCLALERTRIRRRIAESPVGGPTRSPGVRTIRPGYSARR